MALRRQRSKSSCIFPLAHSPRRAGKRSNDTDIVKMADRGELRGKRGKIILAFQLLSFAVWTYFSDNLFVLKLFTSRRLARSVWIQVPSQLLI